MNNRVLDRLVVEHVLEWQIEEDPEVVGDLLAKGKIFSPSTNIADAWEVVEKLRDEVAFLDILPAADHYIVKIQSAHGTDYVTAETAPLAICLAALKVKGVDVCGDDA